VDLTMSEASGPAGYEKSDADPRLIGVIAGIVALFLIVVPFLLLAVYPDAAGRGGVAGDLPTPPGPRLQIDPKADLTALRAAEQRQLETYGWVDPDKHVVRIPIEQSMQLLVQRGLPGWPGAEPNLTVP
jgi:hypothetical protein